MSQLFSSRPIGPLSLKNRIVIAPMCQYSAIDGVIQPWHAQHLGKMAVSGAGLVIVEATGVEPAARISPACPGLWNDEQEAAFAALLKDIRTYSDTPIGIQLAHAGRKGSTTPPWIDNGRACTPEEGAWETFSASAMPFVEAWPTPTALDAAGMQRVIDAFVQSAQRADRAGFDLVELHAAHGYLLTQFLSPITNQRTDEYGGSADNRARFPLQVAQALRDAWPRTKAIGARFNGSDWVEGGLTIEEVTAFGSALHAMGYDYLHLTSGGNVAGAKIPGDQLGFQVPFAEAMKAAEPDATVMAVGMIVTPDQAEQIVASGQADFIALARAVLDDPHWAHHAAVELGHTRTLPNQYERASKAVWPGYQAAHAA